MKLKLLVLGKQKSFSLNFHSVKKPIQCLFHRYPAKVNLHSPNLPTKFPDKERQSYSATRDDPVNLTTLKPHLM